MKKLLIVVIAIALVVWVISWFRVPQAVVTSAARPWPGGMGTLDAVAARFPPLRANDASVKLTALANALPKNDVVENFVTREIVKGELNIGKPPALPDVSAIRELLLREPIVWERGGGIGGDNRTQALRVAQMTMTRALLASAFAKAHANDPAAWEDLHAVWKLARSLDGNPQMAAQTAAFSMARMTNAVAWKMPLPRPQGSPSCRRATPCGRCSSRFSIRWRRTRTTACGSSRRRCSPTPSIATVGSPRS
jgi:hypothetical protein